MCAASTDWSATHALLPQPTLTVAVFQDTFAYAIHHVATVALVLFSAHAGVTRIGGVVMFFFDWADPFLLVAKALVYLSRKPTDMYQWWADRLFETFAVAFFLTRNLMFNYVVFVCVSFWLF